MTVQELIHTMIEVVAFNGNFLLNVGPGADGTINPVFMDRLLGIGTELCHSLIVSSVLSCSESNLVHLYLKL